MLKNVAVKDCEFVIIVSGVEVNSGIVTVNSLPSANSKYVSGEIKKGIYAGTMNITVSGYSDSNISQGMGPGNINPSAAHVFIDHNAVVLEGDSGTAILSGINPQTEEPITGYSVTVKIKDAGQSVIKAE